MIIYTLPSAAYKANERLNIQNNKQKYDVIKIIKAEEYRYETKDMYAF